MSIIRRHKQNQYTTVSNRIYQDPEISAKAKGLHIYLMTLPEDWVIRKTEIPNHFSDGKCSIFSAFDELVENGYIVERHEGGKGHGLKRTSYDIYEFRFSAPANSASENRQLQNTNYKNTKNKGYPQTPASGGSPPLDLNRSDQEAPEARPDQEAQEAQEAPTREEVTEKWNATGATKVMRMTDKRWRKFLVRMQERDFRESLDDIMSRIAKSSFLLGKNNRGWRVDFDWLVANDTNYVKLLEGKYDNDRFNASSAEVGSADDSHGLSSTHRENQEPDGWHEAFDNFVKGQDYPADKVEEYRRSSWSKLPSWLQSELRTFMKGDK